MDCNVRELEFGIGASHAELPFAGSETSLKKCHVQFCALQYAPVVQKPCMHQSSVCRIAEWVRCICWNEVAKNPNWNWDPKETLARAMKKKGAELTGISIEHVPKLCWSLKHFNIHDKMITICYSCASKSSMAHCIYIQDLIIPTMSESYINI